MQLQLIFKYGTIVFLVLLCVLFSWLTLAPQNPMDPTAARRLTQEIKAEFGGDAAVLVVVRENREERRFAERLQEELEAAGLTAVASIGNARSARQKLEELAAANKPLDVIAGNDTTAGWLLFSDLATDYPVHATAKIVKPESYLWPNFLKSQNLRNIANQIAVIAIIAVGMTFVIIAGGIDLSVGSLIALSSVVAAMLIRDLAGGVEASVSALAICSLGGILACGLIGTFSGGMVVWLDIPPFIVTLAMMLVASGLAFILADGNAIHQLPKSYTWLGRESDLIGIPNAVVLMAMAYLFAHITLSKTVLGRYVYAVGDNRQAAWLSGVPVKRVLLFTYILSGLLAGLGGIVVASNFQSGDPRYGIMYELYVIAAVVVGGTSLTGGRGTAFGTLIGALLIGVINNGMNLLHVTPYWQKVILGLVILGAVLLDRLARPTRK